MRRRFRAERAGLAGLAGVAGSPSVHASANASGWATSPGWTAAAGLVGSAVAAPLAARLAHALGLLDRPGPLKPQAAPVPYLGGLAVATGLAAAGATLPAAVRRGVVRRSPPLLASLVLGTVDDAVGLPVSLRLAGELAVGALVARQVGGARSPGSEQALPASGRVSAPLGPTLAQVTATVLATNALNLVDGADGLAAGTALLGALGEAVLLRRLGRAGPVPAEQVPAGPVPEEPTPGERAPGEPGPAEPAPDEITRSALALATGLAGATAGFLWWNRPPARLYLGDGGAYLLGATLALLAAEAAAGPGSTGKLGPRGTGKPGPGGAEIGWATALLPLAYPLAELGFAVIRRLRAGVAPWAGDRAHLYDRLATRRWPTPLPVAACLGLEGGAVLLAVDGARRGGPTRAWCRAGLAASGLLVAGLMGGALRLGA